MEEKVTLKSTTTYQSLAQIIINEGWRLWLLFAVIFSSYLISMPKTVMLEDDGLFIMSSYFLGIAHPPGYPIHTLIGHLFSQVPIGSVASRIHAMSGFFGALGCVMIALVILQLLRSRIAAYPAAMMLAWSPVYWSQSIIAEVYTLNAFFFLLILLLLLDVVDYQAKQSDHNERFNKTLSIKIAAIAFIYGLSLTNHWPLMILSSSCYLIIAWPLLKDIARRTPLILVCFSVGLTPYLWMYLYTPPPPGYAVMGPINSLNDLWFYISRKGYDSVDNSISAGISDKLEFFGFFSKEATTQFFPLGTLLAITGIIYQWKIIGLRISLALVAGLVTTSFLLITLLNFDFDELHQAYIKVYLLPTYIIIATWIALGIFYISKATTSLRPTTHRNLIHAISFTALALVIITNSNENFRHNENWSLLYASTLFSTLERDSVLFTDSDSTVGVIGYLHHIEKIRPDITLMNSNGQLYSNRIALPKYLNSTEREQATHQFLKENPQEKYFTSEPDLGYGTIYNGLTYKTAFNLNRGQRVFETVNIQTLEYLINLSNQPPPLNAWNRIRHKELILNAIPIFVTLHLNKSISSSIATSFIQAATKDLTGKLFLAYTLLAHNKPNEFNGIDRILSQAEKQLTLADKTEKSFYFTLLGKRNLIQEDTISAKNNFHRALKVWPHPTRNMAMEELKTIYINQNKEHEFQQLVNSLQ